MIQSSKDDMEVSLTGLKARPVFGKAKPQNLPVGSGLIVIQCSQRTQTSGPRPEPNGAKEQTSR